MCIRVSLRYLISALILFSLPALGENAERQVSSKVDKNLAIEKKYLNRRYDGFYKNVRERKAYQKKRRKKVLEHKEKRKKHQLSREKIRIKYKKAKAKIKKEEVDLDAIMAKVEKKRAKERRAKRKVFVQRREIMEHLKRTTKKIPEELDVGLKSLDEDSP